MSFNVGDLPKWFVQLKCVLFYALSSPLVVQRWNSDEISTVDCEVVPQECTTLEDCHNHSGAQRSPPSFANDLMEGTKQ